jgi:polysaccharide pyruvyl transferase WcaK-like protein
VNIGDIAHTPGVLHILERELPDVTLTLWPRDINDGVEAMLKARFPKLRIAKGSIGSDSKASTPELAAALEACDLLMHSSGPSLVAEKDVRAFVQATGKPFGVYGITMGDMPESRKILLDQAQFLYLRDSVSTAYVQKQQLSCPVVAFGPDGAFACDVRDDARADAWLASHGLSNAGFVCVIPRFRYTPYFKIRNKAMSDTDKKRYDYSLSLAESDHAKLRMAIIALVREAKVKVLVCPEDESHMAIGKEYLVDPLPDDVKQNVVWRENYWRTDEAVSTYARSLGLVSMDMHSPIMCIGNGIPAIHLRFKEQTSKGFMWKDIGLNDWLFDLDEETDGARITAAALKMVTDRQATMAYAHAAQAVVRKHQVDSMLVVKKALMK